MLMVMSLRKIEKAPQRAKCVNKTFLQLSTKDCPFYLGEISLQCPWQSAFVRYWGFSGLLLVFAVAKFLSKLSGIGEWMMASTGARAFWFPPSPATKPWSVIARNTLSALLLLIPAGGIYSDLTGKI